MDLTKKRKLDDNGLIQPIFDLSITDVRKIISSFTNDQLLDIVQNAAVRHLDVLDAVRSIADQDLSQRKLFIRGLGWDTTNENLAAIFSTYGELDEAVVILDKATGKSKGFGFLTFKHIDGAIRALKEPSKKIDGRMTVTNLASAGPGGGPVMQQPVDVSNRKIYVANVPYEMPADRLLGFFLSYGEIEEGPLGFDKLTGKSKGFALFVYKSEDGAKAALVDPIKNIDGVQLSCKLANDGKKGKGAGGQSEVHGNGVGVGLQQAGVVQGSFGVGQYGGPGGVGGVTGYGGVVYPGGLQGPSPQGQHPQNPLFVGVGGPGYSSLSNQVPISMGYNGAYGTVAGVGAPYSGSQYGGPGATGYGGLGGAATRMGAGVGGGTAGSVSGAGLGAGVGGLGGAGTGIGLAGAAAGRSGAAAGRSGAASGLGGSASALGGAAAGLVGPGHMSSLYGLQPNSAGIAAGAYSDSAHYSLSGGSGYQNQNNLTAGASPAARGPYSGMYPPRY